MKIKPTYRSHIGCDFIDAHENRVTSFQIVTTENGKTVFHAGLDMENGKPYREYATENLRSRMPAIQRLARKHLTTNMKPYTPKAVQTV